MAKLRTGWLRNGAVWLQLLGLTVALACGSTAAARELNLQHYRTGDGLPQTQVRVLYQDQRGFIWVGTYGGIGRYDGREFRVYSTSDGLSANTIEAISGTGSGRIWAGTVAGLCYHDPGASEFRCLADSPLATVHIQALLSDGDALWVGTDHGLYRLDNALESHPVDLGRDGPVNIEVLAKGQDGTLWVGTADGLLAIDSTGAQRRVVSVDGTRGRQVLALQPDGKRLWIGTDAGLYLRRDGNVAVPPGLPASWKADGVTGLTLGHDGELWAASNTGVLRQTGDGFELLTTANGLMTNINFDVYADREGMVWIGNDDGLSKYVPGPFTGYTEQDGLLHYFVRTMNEDGRHNLWLGTRRGAQIVPFVDGQWMFDKSRTITADDGLRDERIYAIAFPAPGEALLATGNGLVRWKAGTGITHIYTERDGLPSNHTQALKIMPDGRVWVGTNLGVVVFDHGRIKPAPDATLARAYVYRIREDRQGRLWFGSRDHGLLRLTPDGKVTALRKAQGFSNETVWDICPDASGGVWVGTNGDGLFHITADGQIRQYTKSDGLVDNFVWQVLVDREGDVWTYTNRGIARFDGKVFTHYGLADGLLHLEGGATGALQTHDGQLWFASAQGLMRYEPAAEFHNPVPPPVVIEGVSRGDNLVAEGAELPYGVGSLDFNYAGLSFQAESALRYRYRLLGAGEQWSAPIPYRPITVANLGGGQYTFEVEARNPDGIWSSEPARFSFSVAPAFWATWWFWALAIAGGGLLVWLGFRIRVRQIRAHQRELEALVHARTVELEQANAKLQAASVTDPLTGLHNRRFLVDQIHTDVAQSRRAYRGDAEFPNRDIIFMMIDLDNFKQINDTYGHGAGDRVLRGYAELIGEQIRESDYVVRWGGEEFLVVARQAESSQCDVIANRLIRNAREARFVINDKGDTVACSCSMGVAYFPFLRDNPDALNWEQIIDVADIAVYLAKALGRDGWIAIQGTERTRVENGPEFLHELKHRLQELVAAGEIKLSGSFDDLSGVSPEGWEHKSRR